MTIDHYDVAIIGAGPAGCACALALHKSGLRVALIDKETFPRDKICGDAIPGLTFKAMDRINPEWGTAMRNFAHKANIHTSKVFAPNGKHITLNWKAFAYNSRRLHFDDFLMGLVRSDTDTHVFENKRLTEVSFGSDNVACHFQDGWIVKASIIIGCDGANSMVSKHSGRNDLSELRAPVAVRSYYSGIAGMETGVNEFYLFDELEGYFWIFPLDNGWANVGFGTSQSQDRESNTPINLRKTMQHIISTAPAIAHRFQDAESSGGIKGFALPLWSGKGSVSGDRWMLCGDAASLIDPLQGHGIHHAMWSGLFAAEQAVACFKSNNFSAAYMERYDEELYQKIGFELKRSALILKLMTRLPRMINFLTWLSKYEKLTDRIARKLRI